MVPVMKGVAAENDLQRLGVLALTGPHQVGGDVLVDGAAGAAARVEAVHQGHLLAVLPVGQGLDGLAVVGIDGHVVAQGVDLGHVHAGEGGAAAVHQ